MRGAGHRVTGDAISLLLLTLTEVGPLIGVDVSIRRVVWNSSIAGVVIVTGWQRRTRRCLGGGQTGRADQCARAL